MNLISFLSGAVFLLLVACHGPDKGKALALNPSVGQRYSFQIEKVKTDIDFHRVDSCEIEASLTCIANADSSVIFQFKVIRAQFDVHNMLKGNDRDRFFSLLTGYSANIKLNQVGAVQKVDVIGINIDTLSIGVGLEPYVIRGILDDHLGKNALADYFNDFFAMRPHIKVSLRDIWSGNILFITKAPIKINRVFTFNSMAADTASISVQSTISARTGEGGTIYLEGKQSGQAEIDQMTGMPGVYEGNGESVYTAGENRYRSTEHFFYSLKKIKKAD